MARVPLFYFCCICHTRNCQSNLVDTVLLDRPCVFSRTQSLQNSPSDTPLSVVMFPHFLITNVHFLPLGECHLLPSCPWHTGYCGLRRALQLLGQRRSHQVKDLGAARPAHYGLLLQPKWQHLCIRFQLRLVEGRGKIFLKVASRCFVFHYNG